MYIEQIFVECGDVLGNARRTLIVNALRVKGKNLHVFCQKRIAKCDNRTDSTVHFALLYV